MSFAKRFLITLVIAIPFVACSGDEGDGDGNSACAGCPFDYSGFDANAGGPVSFQGDVMPILARACNFSTCHGRPVGGRADLYLGPGKAEFDSMGVDPATLQTVHGQMVAPSKTTSGARVAAGQPQVSFLMLKMDGCQDSAAPCMVQAGVQGDGVCGDDMPQSSQLLSCSERDTIRRWIGQGAQLN